MATKLIVITGFLVSFAAGMMVGVRQRIEAPKSAAPMTGIAMSTTGPSTAPGGRRGAGPRSMIVRELGLTPEQTQKMNAIFHKAADVGHDLDNQRRLLRQNRDDEIRTLAKQEQNDKYEKILKDYYDASEKISEEWRDVYTSAVAQTKLILKDDQQKRYDDILTRNHWDGQGENWPWPWGPNEGRGGRGGLPGGRMAPRGGGDRRSNPQNQQNNAPDKNGRSDLGRATTRPMPS